MPKKNKKDLLQLFDELRGAIEENYSALVAEGKKIILKPEAENALLVIYKLKKMVEELDKEAREAIKEEAIKLNPELEQIKAPRLVISLQSFGYKYKIDESYIDKIPESLYERKVRIYAKSDEIEKWIEEHDGKVPVGVIVNRDDDPKKKGIRFYPKKGVEL